LVICFFCILRASRFVFIFVDVCAAWIAWLALVCSGPTHNYANYNTRWFLVFGLVFFWGGFRAPSLFKSGSRRFLDVCFDVVKSRFVIVSLYLFVDVLMSRADLVGGAPT
jgi:hypothetical protein